tara:strand:+ start:204262 stop:205014 length:753 start_codon:yes stop_codon:yes gene_type:complete
MRLPGLSYSRSFGARLLLALSCMVSINAQADTRHAFSVQSPPWLAAVGHLHVPGSKYVAGRRQHHREDCSATLVADKSGAAARIIITAWHCLEYYDDLSKPIVFTALPGAANSVEVTARRLADGGGMHADWAILRLARAVRPEEVAALTIHSERADPARSIVMAGFSRDAGLGQHGKRLTFDPDCQILRQDAHSSDSDCTAYKGASGGAVIQLEESGDAQLCGVISQGDGAGLSTFVPVSGFRATLNQYL